MLLLRCVALCYSREIIAGENVHVGRVVLSRGAMADPLLQQNVPQCALYAHNSVHQLPAAPFHFPFGGPPGDYHEEALADRTQWTAERPGRPRSGGRLYGGVPGEVP